MKSDKKFKKTVENSGRALREKHSDFYSRMINAYYSEEPEKKSVNFFASKKFLAALSACLVLVLVSGVGIGFGIRNRKFNTGVDISLPDNAQIVSVYEEEYLACEPDVLSMSKVARNESLRFGEFGLFLADDVEIYEDKSESGERNFYYLTDSTGNGFFRLTLVVNSEYQQSLRPEGATKQVIVNNLSFNYSVIYSENEKTVYFFAEAESQGELLLIDYTTQTKECEQSFINFLNSLIL